MKCASKQDKIIPSGQNFLKGLNVNKEKNPDATKVPGLSTVCNYIALFKLPSSILSGDSMVISEGMVV